MNHWFAIHYPHYPDDKAEWFIYVPRKHVAKVEQMMKGDHVAFYELKGGPDRSGKGRRPEGRQGVIGIATVSAAPRAREFNETYVTGEATDFALECPCDRQMFGGFVDVTTVRGLVKPGHPNFL